MFFLLAHFAAAAEITVFTQTPAAVSVDGQLLEYDEASLLLVARNLKAGKHTVKVESLARKAITQMEVTLQGTERADFVYGQRTLGKVGGGLVGEQAVTAGYARVPSFGGASGGAAGGVSMAVDDGMGGGVTMAVGVPGMGNGPAFVVIQTAPAAPGAPVPPTPPTPPAPPKPEPVQVVFSLKDSFDMSNVYVDGKRVAEFRTGDKEKIVTLMSGTHTVEVKDFTEFETWFKGTLNVTAGEPLRVGFGEEDGVEVYNRPASAWMPR